MTSWNVSKPWSRRKTKSWRHTVAVLIEEKKGLEEELNALAGELAVSVGKSEELKKRIPAGMLRKYEQIKGIGRGVAVVSVWKEVCDGCHMSIPLNCTMNCRKSDNLTTCPNCNRIIYWETGMADGRPKEVSEQGRWSPVRIAGSEESPNSTGQDGR